MDWEERCDMATMIGEDVFDVDAMDKVFGTVVTRSHYVQKTDRDKCSNDGCGTSFQYPSLRRPHHCRRCGEVFCRDCLRNKRRLNVMAQPDLLGVLCKVCPRCYDDRGVDLGCTIRSRTNEFVEIRKKAKADMDTLKVELTIQTRRGSFEPVCWKEQMKVDIPKECKRLLDGYKHATDNSDTINQLQVIRSHLKTPSWTKSTFWKLEQNTLTCRECGFHTENRHQIKNCKVCGLAMCKKCAHKELLLYFEDSERRSKTAMPKLAVIRVQGSPEKEPIVSMLLHCCSDCKEEISKRQTDDEEWYKEKPKPPDFDTEFVKLDGELRKLSEDISEDIEKLSLEAFDQNEEQTDTCDDKNKAMEQPSNIGCLKESLDKKIEIYYLQFVKLKSLIISHADSVHGGLIQLTKNYLYARSEFYVGAKHKLSQVVRREDN